MDHLLTAVVETASQPFVVLSPDLRIEHVNRAFCEVFGVGRDECLGRSLLELGSGRWDVPELRRLLEEVLPEKGRVEDFRLDYKSEATGRRAMLLNAHVVAPAEQRPPMILLSMQDVTEDRIDQMRQQVVVAELQHRMKNLLANVGALARQIYRRSGNLEEFADGFERRLYSMARVQDLLVGGLEGRADLHQLILGEFHSIGAREDEDFTLSGEPMALDPRQAQVIGMIVHELATNAAKYGAISQDGTVVVSWSERIESEGATFEFLWREQGVRMLEQPERAGFGTQVLEKSAPFMLDGEASLVAQPDGVEYRLIFARTGA